MDIDAACRIIRQCNDSFVYRTPFEGNWAPVFEAVAIVKSHLEGIRTDGKSIKELEISDYLLCTAQGMRWVMRYVSRVEAMRGWGRR